MTVRCVSLIAAAASGVVALLFLWDARVDGIAAERPARISVASVLAEVSNAGFARITGPAPLAFPRDHGPHPDQQIEWWYFTGNLEDEGGDRLGFQLTFFRTGLSPEPLARDSAWAARETWMAHFTITDAARGRFHSFERFARGAAGLAGASADPFRVWTESWSATSTGDSFLPLRLEAREGDLTLALDLTEAKPIVLQGEGGFSRKGPESGQASRYVSYTRLHASGRIGIAGRDHRVSGLAWMDHEWSTSVLSGDLVGWDWFSLQLADERDLMLYLLRQRDGSISLLSAGILVSPDGAVTRLARADFSIAVGATWKSAETGIVYPSAWRIRVPSAALDLEVRPVLADQELRHGVVYWEGAVEAAGRLAGRGYVELVGYDEG